MTIIGIDTSGKIGQLPIYVAAVKIKNPKTLNELRESLIKKKTVFGTRRKFDAKYLNKNDIENLVRSIQHSATIVTSNVYSEVLYRFSHIKKPSIRVLASTMYMTSKNLSEKNDTILVDKDYDYERMKFLCSTIKTLFRKIDSNELEVEIGTSYNDSISIADVTASLCRLGKLEYQRLEADKLISVLNEL
ncbi:MAG: hypothetical protein HYW24_05500 [Candidatus Aenigmarchaeota archaeon]|nr:hypothetical protein [Candidatus Aenigmarchaeota archaeon]